MAYPEHGPHPSGCFKYIILPYSSMQAIPTNMDKASDGSAVSPRGWTHQQAPAGANQRGDSRIHPWRAGA